MPTLREVFNKDLVLSYLPADPIRETKFWMSGAFNSDGRVSKLIAAGSQGFEVPYINDIDANVEPNYSNTIFTDIAVPRGITAGKMKGLLAYLNEGFLEARLERYLTGISPLAEIAKQINGYWQQEAELRAVSTLVGIRNFDHANGNKITTTVATAFNVEVFIDAESTMAEKYRGKGAIVMHPTKAADLRKSQLLRPFADPIDLKPVEMFNGRIVIESYRGTVVGTTTKNYITWLLNENSFAAESVFGNDDLELDRDGSRANGGGTTVLWTRRNVLIHPQGMSFIADSSALTGGTANEAISASWEDLQKGENWELSVEDITKIPFRIIVSK